jgi:hypothetical protein
MKLKLYFYQGFKNVTMIENEVSITHYNGRMRPDIKSTSRIPNVKRFYKLNYQIITYQGYRTVV